MVLPIRLVIFIFVKVLECFGKYSICCQFQPVTWFGMFIRSLKDMYVPSSQLVVPVVLFVECWVLCPGPHSVPGRVLRTESLGSWVRASINPLGPMKTLGQGGVRT